jgi:hypothetical protein
VVAYSKENETEKKAKTHKRPLALNRPVKIFPGKDVVGMKLRLDTDYFLLTKNLAVAQL